MTHAHTTDHVLSAFIDRILRMKEQEDAIKADIREIYAEAKGQGFDKTQLGNVVAYLRKLEKDEGGEAEKRAVFDLYLTAYERAKSGVGTVDANAHAHEQGVAA